MVWGGVFFAKDTTSIMNTLKCNLRDKPRPHMQSSPAWFIDTPEGSDLDLQKLAHPWAKQLSNSFDKASCNILAMMFPPEPFTSVLPRTNVHAISDGFPFAPFSARVIQRWGWRCDLLQ